MRPRRHRLTPGFERCEARLALAGATGSAVTPPAGNAAGLVGPGINPVLSAYAEGLPDRPRPGPEYNPAADVNHNGLVAMGDALPILRSLAPITPRVATHPLILTLAPGEQANTPHPANSGGVTRATKQVTIIGRTTPNSLVFTDDSNNDFKFKGGTAIPVDASGNFTVTIRITSPYKLSQHDVLVMDPFGHQLRRAFPILQILAG